MNSKTARMAGVAILVLQLWSGTMAAVRGKERQVIVGETGVITLKSVTKVGSLTLQPGRYIFHHSVHRSGGRAVHFVMFSPLLKGGISPSQPSEQECQLEPLHAKATRTRVFLVDEDGGKRITRIEIKGENVAHVF